MEAETHVDQGLLVLLFSLLLLLLLLLVVVVLELGQACGREARVAVVEWGLLLSVEL